MDDMKACQEMHKSMDHKIMDQFIHVMKLHRSTLERRLHETGVHRGQHHLLMCIARNPDLSQKELAEIQNVSTAAIAVSLKKLEKGGYVERVVDARDNRSNNIRITEKGRSVVCHSIHIFQATEQQAFAGFSEEEKQQFLSYLVRAGENIKRSDVESCGSIKQCFKTEREGKNDEAL